MHYSRKMKTHMASCGQNKEAEKKIQVVLGDNKPFVQKFYKKLLFSQLFARGIIDINGKGLNGNLDYLAINGFISLYFETMEEIINEKTSDSTTLLSVLHLLLCQLV